MSFDKARELIDNSLLFNKIIEFNRAFNISAAPESDSASHLFLKKKDANLYLFKKRERKGSFIPFYAEPDRLCLIDNKTLSLLSMYLGSAVLYKSLQQILFKQDRELLFSFLDRSIYDFTLSCGRYSLPPELVMSDIIDLSSLKDAIVSHGCACLSALASLMTDERLKEHFTARIKDLSPRDFKVVDNEHAMAIYKLCIRILTQEIDTTWLKYFA